MNIETATDVSLLMKMKAAVTSHLLRIDTDLAGLFGNPNKWTNNCKASYDKLLEESGELNLELLKINIRLDELKGVP